MGSLSTGKTFRIFVSSTFSDLKAERNALQEKVFPKLRELCIKYGCRFQAIDLRWGISEEAGFDQQTMNICLQELERCQRITPKPNFIVLLGDRYGWQPLPPQIESVEFESILEKISWEDKQFVVWNEHSDENSGWYRKDENAVPNEYCLRPRTVIFKAGASEAEKQTTREDEAERWGKTEDKLHSILIKAIDQLGWPADDPRRIKYEASATHQEILHGALKVTDASAHVFCFSRTIDNIPGDSTGADFIDLDKDGHLNKLARAKLTGLRSSLRNLLGDKMYEYKTRWIGNDITFNHLDTLCNDAFNALSRIIVEQAAALNETDELEAEIAAHKSFGEKRAELFTGRHEVRGTINNYLKTYQSYPLVISGEPGSGKTALMAFAAAQAHVDHSETKVVFRSIGATPTSSDVRLLLESLCRQISRDYVSDISIVPAEYPGLVNELNKKLSLATKQKPLIVFLDAIDQIADSDYAQTFSWIPVNLPEYVHLVVSVSSRKAITKLQYKIPEQNFVELKPMLYEERESLLNLLLKYANRNLQPDQRWEILNNFRKNGLPLYLKLAFEQVRQWKSYDSQVRLSSDIGGIIRNLFTRLSSEINHGGVLVSHSLGYLATAKDGLAEDELIDILSLDEAVISDFLRRSPRSPRVKSLPVVVWSRLYYDLEPYLSESAADGNLLITFYHRQFLEVVAQDYLSEPSRKSSHLSLADYFAKRGYDYQRTLSELPYQLYQFAGESGDNHRLYNLADDVDFRTKLFQHFGRPQPIVTLICYALDLAFKDSDIQQTIHFSSLRLNVNKELSKAFLYRFSEIAGQNLELARSAVNLVPDLVYRRLGLLVLACLYCSEEGQRELTRELVKEANGINVISNISQTPVLFEMVKYLYLNDIEEAKRLVWYVPQSPTRQLYMDAWSTSQQFKGLAAEMERAKNSVRSAPENEISDYKKLNSFAEKYIIKTFSIPRPEKFEVQLTDLFGPEGVSNVYCLIAAGEFNTGHLTPASILLNRAIYVASNLPAPPIRTLSAIAGAIGAAGNMDLMEELTQRVRVFVKGLEMMAKSDEEHARIADMQSDLYTTTENVAQTWRPSSSAQLFEQSIEEISTSKGQNTKESLLTMVARARQLLARGQTKPIHNIMSDITSRLKSRQSEVQVEALYISVYAIAKVCNYEDYVTTSLIALKAKGLNPDVLFQKENSNPSGSALFELLSASDPRCVAAVALCLRLSGNNNRLLEFARTANSADTGLEVMDALISQLVQLPGTDVSALRRFSEDILGITGQLKIPPLFGWLYYPGFMLWSLWCGLVLLVAGMAAAIPNPKLLIGGAILTLAGWLGGAADLVVWNWLRIWERPEIGRRLVTESGTFAVYLLAAFLIRNLAYPFDGRLFYGVLVSALFGSLGMVLFIAKGYIFAPLSSRIVWLGTASAIIIAIRAGYLSWISQVKDTFAQVLMGVFWSGALSLSFCLNIVSKRIPVLRHYGSHSDFTYSALKK